MVAGADLRLAFVVDIKSFDGPSGRVLLVADSRQGTTPFFAYPCASACAFTITAGDSPSSPGHIRFPACLIGAESPCVMDLPPRSIAGQDMCVVSGAPLSNHFLNEFTLVVSCFVQVASPPLVLGFGRSCLYLMALPPRTDLRAG